MGPFSNFWRFLISWDACKSFRPYKTPTFCLLDCNEKRTTYVVINHITSVPLQAHAPKSLVHLHYCPCAFYELYVNKPFSIPFFFTNDHLNQKLTLSLPKRLSWFLPEDISTGLLSGLLQAQTFWQLPVSSQLYTSSIFQQFNLPSKSTQRTWYWYFHDVSFILIFKYHILLHDQVETLWCKFSAKMQNVSILSKMSYCSSSSGSPLSVATKTY